MEIKDTGIEEEIRRLGLDTRSALQWAQIGKIEEWVHRYLLSGRCGKTNPEFSAGLKREKRWWNGPLEIKLDDLSPAVGTEPGMEYVVDEDEWRIRTGRLAQTFTDPQFLPPLIAEFRDGELSIRDGNTRIGAMRLLGWSSCWVVIWYNTLGDFDQHNQLLVGEK